MALFDPKLRHRKVRYLAQCALATVCIMLVLTLLDMIAHAAIIASLGATTFVIFALPRSAQSRPRVVLGGYLIGVLLGAACHGLARSTPAAIGTERFVTIAYASASVGLSIFLMTATNTEHPPAAGIALGLVLEPWSFRTVAIILAGVSALVLMKRILRSSLADLA